MMLLINNYTYEASVLPCFVTDFNHCFVFIVITKRVKFGELCCSNNTVFAVNVYPSKINTTRAVD